MSMADKREAALEVISRMLSPEVATTMSDPRNSTLGFARELGDLSMSNVFEALWTRPGLDVRTRSIVTVSLLIALRATHELAVHIPAAIRNGVTLDEMEEIIYQASAYAGFPAASTARGVAEEELRKAGMIE
jgi:4-carboxymuconolactone decarboxylase